MAMTALIALLLVAAVQWRAGQREAAAEEAYPPSGHLIDIGTTKVHAVVMGQGPDLVLIHGASGSVRDYTFGFAQRMAETHRVILLDRPGLGWSERPPGYGGAFNNRAESPTVQAQILQQAADKIGVINPIVMGSSYGGAVALAWALERPSQTAALVLVAAASNPWPSELDLLYRLNASLVGSALVIPMITAFTPKRIIDQTVESIFAPQPMPPGYLEHFGDGMTLRRSTMRANAQQVNTLLPHVIVMSQRYGSLPMPVEIVHGDADTIVPLHIHSEPLSRQIPGAKLTVLPGIGHMPHHTAEDEVASAILRAQARAGLR